MLTEKSTDTPAPAVHHAPKPGALDDLICYFEGDFVPMRDAKVSIMTHAFMYGTATFEGIRAYWNEEQGRLYGLKVREHVERIRQSCRILMIDDVPSVDELTGLIVETVRRNGFREDAYIRPSFYKSTACHRRAAPRPRQRAVHRRPAVRELRRHGARRPAHDLVLAAQRGRGDPGARQDRRRLREHGLPEDRGRAQRLRRGARADGRRARQRGVRGEPVRHPRRRGDHAAGQRRPPRGRHAQGAPGDPRATRGSPSRSARSTARSCTSPTRRSCAGPASRSPRSSRSTTARSDPARSGRSAGSSASATSTRCAGDCPSTSTG